MSIKPDWVSECGSVTLYRGDCLAVLPELEAGSVDAVVTDPPYGTTACKWDSVLPLDQMWSAIRGVIRTGAVVVMTASQPFTTTLISSNRNAFRYCWIYHKNNPTGFLDARRRPMNDYEDVVVFAEGPHTYNPQGVRTKRTKRGTEVYGAFGFEYETTGENYPRRVLPFARPSRTVHPTEKPVALMQYMVSTYTNEGEVVLDNTMGSGTTGVACVNTERRFIGVEKSPEYFDIAVARIQKVLREKAGLLPLGGAA